MKFAADLHLHSSYARATSKNLNFDTLSEWAKKKGIDLLSSADFTHPEWFRETRLRLKESGNGIYEYHRVKFILGSEISCIYTQGGKVRRIHCLLYFPNISNVESFNANLGQRANLSADGRPIVGLSARELLDLALSVSDKAILIPAHAWTPWFSLYGSNSGFDSIEECFGDLSKYIYAIETGLSSNPAMNWRIKDLDERSIVSFSDAHSAPKMGRELTIFDTVLSYDGILDALRKEKISGTIEFFPEEGKYHFTGHRNCGIKHSPEETDKYGFNCPKCGRTLTVGVMHRVEQLAEKNRPEGYKDVSRPGYKMTVPFLEILSEALEAPVTSERVKTEYESLIRKFGSELSILLETKTNDIDESTTNPRISKAVKKVREGDIVIEPGYDGVFGTVKIWPARPAGGPRAENREPKNVGAAPKTSLKAEGQINLFDS